jgi:pimeloyl-ACP methyl ester carboxylesterase
VIFALAHMSCAQAWAWGEVPARLRDAGHEVVAPDLPLHAGVTPMEHAGLLAGAVDGDGPVVVAGHSYGGVVALPAAELLGERCRAVVVVDGIVCDDGESAHDARGDKARARREEASRRGDGMWTPGEPDPGDPDWFDRLEPMPLSAMDSPISLSGEVNRLPRTFVLCERWGMGEQAERALERGWRVVEVDSSHAFPLLRPAECARLLLEAADRPT